MTKSTSNNDYPPLTLERLNDLYRSVVRERQYDECIAWLMTLDAIPYSVSSFLVSDKLIWMKETDYYHAFVAFPTNEAAQEISVILGKPLIHVRDIPPKPWPTRIIEYRGSDV